MGKFLRNKTFARWVIGITVVGLIAAYMPLLFVPQEQQYLPQENQEPQNQNVPLLGNASNTPPYIVTSTANEEVVPLVLNPELLERENSLYSSTTTP